MGWRWDAQAAAGRVGGTPQWHHPHPNPCIPLAPGSPTHRAGFAGGEGHFWVLAGWRGAAAIPRFGAGCLCAGGAAGSVPCVPPGPAARSVCQQLWGRIDRGAGMQHLLEALLAPAWSCCWAALALGDGEGMGSKTPREAAGSRVQCDSFWGCTGHRTQPGQSVPRDFFHHLFWGSSGPSHGIPTHQHSQGMGGTPRGPPAVAQQCPVPEHSPWWHCRARDPR